VIDKLKRIWKETVVAQCRYHPSIFLEEKLEENDWNPQKG
jgi:hypothetical protein